MKLLRFRSDPNNLYLRAGVPSNSNIGRSNTAYLTYKIPNQKALGDLGLSGLRIEETTDPIRNLRGDLSQSNLGELRNLYNGTVFGNSGSYKKYTKNGIINVPTKGNNGRMINYRVSSFSPELQKLLGYSGNFGSNQQINLPQFTPPTAYETAFKSSGLSGQDFARQNALKTLGPQADQSIKKK